MGSIEAALIAHLVREALEGVLEPSLASAVLFEALSELPGQELPSEPTALRRFVRDQLAPPLSARLGPGPAQELVEQLDGLVTTAFGGAAKASPSQLPTGSQRVEEGPVRVLLVASVPSLANRLRLALGSDAVQPYVAPTAEVALRILSGLGPSIVLIDGENELPFDAGELAEPLKGCEGTLMLVWGAAEPDGSAALAALHDHDVPAIGLDTEDRSAPLMDYVLSRRAQTDAAEP